MGDTSKVCGMLLVMLLTASSFIVFSIYHRKYYLYMKDAHKAEWLELMKRDPVVDTTGEWIRWPVGSVYLLMSIFKVSETYNDKKVEYYKKRAVLFFATFITSFVLVLVLAVVLSKG